MSQAPQISKSTPVAMNKPRPRVTYGPSIEGGLRRLMVRWYFGRAAVGPILKQVVKPIDVFAKIPDEHIHV